MRSSRPDFLPREWNPAVVVSGADHLPGPGARIHPKGRGNPPPCRGLLAGNGLAPRGTRLQHRFQGRHAIAFPRGFPIVAGGVRTTRLFMNPGTAAMPDWVFRGRGHRLITRHRGSRGRILRGRCPVPGVRRPPLEELPGSGRAARETGRPGASLRGLGKVTGSGEPAPR